MYNLSSTYGDNISEAAFLTTRIVTCYADIELEVEFSFTAKIASMLKSESCHSSVKESYLLCRHVTRWKIVKSSEMMIMTHNPIFKCKSISQESIKILTVI